MVSGYHKKLYVKVSKLELYLQNPTGAPVSYHISIIILFSEGLVVVTCTISDLEVYPLQPSDGQELVQLKSKSHTRYRKGNQHYCKCILINSLLISYMQ